MTARALFLPQRALYINQQYPLSSIRFASATQHFYAILAHSSEREADGGRDGVLLKVGYSLSYAN